MPDELELAGCRVDLARQVVHRPGGDVHLTPIEARLLGHLVARDGAVVPREELLKEVWGWRSTRTRAVATAVWRLREKIEATPAEPAHLLTVGGGYRLALPPRVTAPRSSSGDSGPFVGRGELLAQIRAALDERRLVTLVGPGGVGKTRTALEVTSDHPRTRFVDLSGCLGPDSMRASVAAALQWDEPTDAATLAAALRDQPGLLLILDNAEGVVTEVAALAADALSGPGPTLLVTSREPLQLGAEHVVRLGGLPPEDALALFRLRAPSVVDEPAIAEVIDVIDGLPLAIELAAAWVPVLSPAELSIRLRQAPLDLLSSERRDRPPRHVSLRAVVSASWDLLDAGDREVLAGCARFATGPTPSEAEAILVQPQVLRRLRRLCDRSMARVQDGRVLPWSAVRAFAREQGGADGVDARHAAYFSTLGGPATLAAVERGTDQDEVHRLVGARAELIRAASWALQAGALDQAAACARAVAAVARWRGPRAEAAALLARVAACPGVPDPGALLTDRVSLLRLSGRYDESLALCEELLSGELEAPRRARVLRMRGLIRSERGDPRGARADLEAARDLAVQVGDLAAEGMALGNLAFLDWLEGDRDRAEAGSQRGVEILRSVGHRRAEAQLVANLAAIRAAGGQDPTVQFEEALALHRSLGNRQSEVTLRLGWAGAMDDAGRRDDARDQYAEALALARGLGSPLTEARCAVNAAALEVDLGEDPEGALALLQGALPALRAAGDRRFQAVALLNLAALADARGESGEALRAEAAALAEAVGDREVEETARR